MGAFERKKIVEKRRLQRLPGKKSLTAATVLPHLPSKMYHQLAQAKDGVQPLPIL